MKKMGYGVEAALLGGGPALALDSEDVVKVEKAKR
jgi:hypothetical protein